MTRLQLWAIGLFVLALSAGGIIVEAQQRPNPVAIWCQDAAGNYAPCQGGNQLDYDSGGGTVNQGTVGLVAPASGGPVALPGDATNGLLVNLGANNDVTVTGSVTANAGTNLNTSSLLTTSAHDAAFGTAGSADAQVRTVQGIASMTPLLVNGSGVTQPVSGTVTVTQGTGTNLHMVCDSGCSSSSGFTDNAAFTFGTTAINPIGGVLDDVSTNAATENSAAVARITAQKALHANLRNASGTEVGTSGSPLRVDPTGSTTQPISGTVTANAGTGTFTIQSNASINVAQMNGVATTMGAGNTGTGVQRVIEATDSQLSAGVGATSEAAATAGSTGSLNAKLRLMTSQLDTISSNLSSLLTSSQLVDDDQTGASVHYRTSAGTTEDEHQVKGSAGRLFSITATNTNAAVRYLRCADQVIGSTTPGTTTVFLGLAIPGATTGAGFTTNFGPAGIAFSTGLTCWLVTGAADSDVAEVAANEIKVIYAYK